MGGGRDPSNGPAAAPSAAAPSAAAAGSSSTTASAAADGSPAQTAAGAGGASGGEGEGDEDRDLRKQLQAKDAELRRTRLLLQQERARHAAELFVYAHSAQKQGGAAGGARGGGAKGRDRLGAPPPPPPPRYDPDLFAKEPLPGTSRGMQLPWGVSLTATRPRSAADAPSSRRRPMSAGAASRRSEGGASARGRGRGKGARFAENGSNGMVTPKPLATSSRTEPPSSRRPSRLLAASFGTWSPRSCLS